MDLNKAALLLTQANLNSNKSALAKVKDKRKVAFRASSNDEINYLIPSNMKRKSFDNMIVKNIDIISEFEDNNKTSINLI